MTKPASGNWNNPTPKPSGRTSPGANAAQLIDHHENWVRDSLLWLPIKTKDAALSGAWLVLKARQGTPTWHDLLDALRVAALHAQDRYRVIHDDVIQSTDSDEE